MSEQTVKPIIRKADTGQSGNAGEFGNHKRPEATIALAPGTSRELLNSDLKTGDVIIGDGGGRVVVDDVAYSSAMPGFMAVECEYGTLYLDADETSVVAADDEVMLSVPVKELSEVDLVTAINAARANGIATAGVLLTSSDMSERLSDIIEDGDFSYDEATWLENNFDAVLAEAVNTSSWEMIDRSDDEDATRSEAVYKSLRTAIENLNFQSRA